MTRRRWILLSLLVPPILLICALFPNKPVFLGQWSVVTEGHAIGVIGKDISVTVESIEIVGEHEIEQTPRAVESMIFTVDGVAQAAEDEPLINNRGFSLRTIALPFFEHFAFIQVLPEEKMCATLPRNLDANCFMDLMRASGDPSYCDMIDPDKTTAGIARCYNAYASFKKDASLCDLIPSDAEYAKEWTEKCLENLSGQSD